MSNPLNNQNSTPQKNPIDEMLNFLNNGGSKEQIFNQLRKMVMQLAKKQGIDIKQVEELARKLGAK